MESYVVRIYRRDTGSPQNIVGLVELVDVDKKKSFTNFDELRAILDGRQGPSAREDVNKRGETNGKSARAE
jgi:hypothetical protein